jgi:hypothetical protein
MDLCKGQNVWQELRMADGRLVRVSKYRGDPRPVGYIVAIAGPVEAIALVRAKLGDPGDEIEDAGRVTDTLLTALKLGRGDFVRA